MLRAITAGSNMLRAISSKLHEVLFGLPPKPPSPFAGLLKLEEKDALVSIKAKITESVLLGTDIQELYHDAVLQLWIQKVLEDKNMSVLRELAAIGYEPQTTPEFWFLRSNLPALGLFLQKNPKSCRQVVLTLNPADIDHFEIIKLVLPATCDLSNTRAVNKAWKEYKRPVSFGTD